MTPGATQYGALGALEKPLALGLLRLSTEGRPPEAEAIELIHHALDSGIRVLDTADSYCLNDEDMHYGEHLVRKSLSSWSGAASEVRVVTKVGLTRPDGRWIPRPRAEHIKRSAEESLRALGVERIFMLLLHVKDYRAPFEEALRALAELQSEGKVEHLGLCNVGIAEVRQAQRHFDVAALQVELSVMARKASTEGLVALARSLEIPFMAHRPLGGHAKVEKLLKNRAMKPLSAKYEVSPHEAALATLLDLPDPVLPIFGATRKESIDSSLRALSIQLDGEDRERRQKISFTPTEAALKGLAPPLAPDDLPTLEPGAEPQQQPEVVLIMGIQGAGKSSRVEAYQAKGYARLNRDLEGGKLNDLVPKLDALLTAGQRRVVMDNTYASCVSRYLPIRTAHAHGVPVRCVHLATPIDEALINVVQRMLERYGKLLGPEELAELGKKDENLPPPSALATYASSFEPPRSAEGFSVIDTVDFERRPMPEQLHHEGKGLLLDVDGTIRVTKSGAPYPSDPDDIELLPRRREVLQRWLERGYQLFFISNQSGVASGKVSLETAEACFARTVDLLDLPIAAIRFCPHKAFPVSCFCRKPMPGFGITLMREFELSKDHLMMVGDMDSDEQFARAVGASYHEAKDFFA